MRHIIIILSALLIPACAATTTVLQQGGGPLAFDADGEFKIVQFTDLHYNADKPESRIVLKRIDEVLDAEKPGLVVITGDIIYSKPAEKALRDVLDCVSAHGIPFCTTFGNHDADFGMSKAAMYDLIRSYPNCVMPARDGAESPDYAIAVKGRDGKDAALVYGIDSNAHLFNEDGKFTGYDFIHPEQIEWYRAASEAFTKANGGSPLPSLAFFHIPVPEFHDAIRDENCFLMGTRLENVAAPKQNSGFFDACKEMGDIMGMFVGHDHDSDFATIWKDIVLAYGRFTGGNTEYNDLPNGARVIVLKEGKREFDTYIILKGGEIINRLSYPASFHRDSEWYKRPLDPECKK